MRGSNGTNPAAGTRVLGARSAARVLDHQADIVAISIRLDEIVIAIAPMLGDLHRGLRSIEQQARSANERVSAATYEPPSVASMAWAA